MKSAVGLIGGGLLAICLAHATPVRAEKPALLQGLPCANGVIAADEVVAAIIVQAHVKIRGRVLASASRNTLGDDLAVWRNSPDEDLRTHARALDTLVRNLFDPAQDGDPDFVVVSVGSPAGMPRRFLNRQADDQVVFRCERAIPNPAQREQPRRPSAWRQALIVTSTADGGRSRDLADRPFASFSWLDNRESNEQTASVDLFVGFSSPIWFDVVSPSLAYQRRTGASPLNDLTLALEAKQGRWAWSAAYETDDAFESALYRAQFDFAPYDGPNPCASVLGRSDHNGPRRGGHCDLWIIGDHVDIADAGAKTALAGRREFTRAGVRVTGSWWTEVGDSDAAWLLSGSYTAYETIGGDDGDAALGRISLEYLPSRSGSYSFGLTYERGEDLTSFTAIDQIKLTLGFRR